MGVPQALRRAYNSAIDASADAIARGANRVGGQAPMRGALAGNPVGIMEEARKTLVAAYQSAKPAGKKALQKFLDDPESFTALPEQVIERLARGDVSAVADAARFTIFPSRTAGQWMPPKGGVYSSEAIALGAGTAGAVGGGILAGGAVASSKPSSPADLSDGLTGAPQDDITPEPVAGENPRGQRAAPPPASRQAMPSDTPPAPQMVRSIPEPVAGGAPPSRQAMPSDTPLAPKRARSIPGLSESLVSMIMRTRGVTREQAIEIIGMSPDSDTASLADALTGAPQDDITPEPVAGGAGSLQIEPEGRGMEPNDFQSKLTGESYSSPDERLAAEQAFKAKDPKYKERADLAKMRVRATMDAKSLGMTYEQAINEFDEYADLRAKTSTRDKRWAQRRLDNLSERDAEMAERRRRISARNMLLGNDPRQNAANAFLALGEDGYSDRQKDVIEQAFRGGVGMAQDVELEKARITANAASADRKARLAESRFQHQEKMAAFAADAAAEKQRLELLQSQGLERLRVLENQGAEAAARAKQALLDGNTRAQEANNRHQVMIEQLKNSTTLGLEKIKASLAPLTAQAEALQANTEMIEENERRKRAVALAGSGGDALLRKEYGTGEAQEALKKLARKADRSWTGFYQEDADRLDAALRSYPFNIEDEEVRRMLVEQYGFGGRGTLTSGAARAVGSNF